MSSPIAPPPTAPKTTLAKTIAASDTADQRHLEMALVELDLANACYVDAEAYYEGRKAEEFSHPRIARALRKTRDKYKVNFAKTPVNVVADRLRISSVTVKTKSEGEPEDTEPTADNDLTKTFEREVWAKRKLKRFTRNLNLRVCEYGDAYVFVWTDTEDIPDPDDEELTRTVSNNSPVLYYNSPKTTRVIYDPEAPDRPMFAIKRWRHYDKTYRVNLYYPDRTEHFKLREGAKPESKEAADPKFWESMGEATENPYKRLPIFHYRNGEPYGTPEHADAYGPQDAINKISTTMVHSTEASGFPQRFALAKPNSELIGGAPGDDWDDETEATQPEDTGPNEMQGGPGTILRLDNTDSVGTFEVGSPDTMLKPAEFYIRAMAQTTTTPLRYFYPPGAHPPSGESYRAEDTPLVNKVIDRQEQLEDTYRDMFAFCMEIVTEEPAENFTVDVKWAPAASIDDALGWDTVKKRIDAGVPRRQALIEAGYTADQVDSWLAENNDKAELQRDVEAFSLFAAAAKNLADAAVTKNLNPEAVGKVLTTMLQKFYDGADKLALPEPPEENEHELPGRLPSSGIEPPPHLDLPPGGIPEMT